MYLIQLVRRAPAGSTKLPPPENHSFNNLTEMTLWRDQALKRPSTRSLRTFVMIDETTPAAHQQALDAVDERTRLHSERMKARAVS
jgi:hypothetical protein